MSLCVTCFNLLPKGSHRFCSTRCAQLAIEDSKDPARQRKKEISEREWEHTMRRLDALERNLLQVADRCAKCACGCKK